MTRITLISVALLLAGFALAGCNLLSGTVACNLDRDCPQDAGISFCTSWDAGLGECVGDEAYRGDFPPGDGGTTIILFPDAGPEGDAGTSTR